MHYDFPLQACIHIWIAMAYWRWNFPCYCGYLIFRWLHLKNVEMRLTLFPWWNQHPLLRSQLKGKTHQRLLSFSLISNKGGPTGKGTQTGGNPCLPVHLGWGGRRILILTESLALTNCPASCNSCIDSDTSLEMMPEPTLVTPQTAGLYVLPW